MSVNLYSWSSPIFPILQCMTLELSECPSNDFSFLPMIRRTGHVAMQRQSWLNSTNLTTSCRPTTLPFLWQRGSWKANSRPCKSDLDEMLNEAKTNEEKAKKAMVDAARLADELRAEQEHALQQEKMRKAMEQQIKELQVRLDEAEQAAPQGRQEDHPETGAESQGIGTRTGIRTEETRRCLQEPAKGREEGQGTAVPGRRGPQEPRENARSGRQTAAEDQNLQEADRRGRRESPPSTWQSSGRFSKNWKMPKNELTWLRMLLLNSALETDPEASASRAMSPGVGVHHHK